MGAFEYRLAARGNVTFVYWSTIIQSIALVLVVNHALGCGIFFLGKGIRELGGQKLQSGTAGSCFPFMRQAWSANWDA